MIRVISFEEQGGIALKDVSSLQTYAKACACQAAMSYLYKSTITQPVASQPRRVSQDLHSRTVGRELNVAGKVRQEFKDTVSSSLQIKGPKQAEALQFVEMRILRQQLEALPGEIREDARRTYSLTQNNQQKTLQDFQCHTLTKIEAILKGNIARRNDDPRKYRIGGHDKGTYERFFRVEPMQIMSKAQFTTAMRLTFGNELIKFEGLQGKLFDSFDHRGCDEMDWRSFLFLLAMLMQPMLLGESLLRLGFALYSSVGSLDMTCSDPITFGRLKRLLTTPCLLSYHSHIVHQLDEAYQTILQCDTQAMQHVAKQQAKVALGGNFDPDDTKIPYWMFVKLLHTSPLKELVVTGSVYGSRDSRPWTSALEDHFYHPILLQHLKVLRREIRCADEAALFLSLRDSRTKASHLRVWISYRERRKFFRLVLIATELRAALANYAVFVDHWRLVCVQHRHAISIQRVMRGHIARKRFHFLYRLRKKVTLIQKTSRSAMKRWVVGRGKVRLYWAAVAIQRVFRGRRARKRVATMVEAEYDRQRYALRRRYEKWLAERQLRASLRIQTCIRRFLRRRRTMKRLHQEELRDQVEREMRQHLRERRVEDEVYRQEVSQWYRERKEKYDESALHEQQTALQKKAIVARRMQKVIEERARKKKLREEEDHKREEERVELWIKNWEEEIPRRGQARRVYCRNCLALPEDPDQVKLKKDLAARIKLHIKDVLRRADAQKIPMEIPQAQAQATEEIIQMEVDEAMRLAREDMQRDGQRLEAEKLEKARLQAEQEANEKRRKAKWAVVTIQCYARVFLARKRVRTQAYKRYRKHFDKDYHEYFYEDRQSGQTFWEKPAVLGSYDIDMEPYWIILHSRLGEGSAEAAGEDALFYYYNPATWEQRWKQPRGTCLCPACKMRFSAALLVLDGADYCIPDLAKRCAVMEQEGFDPRNIHIRLFEGGREDAQTMNLDDVAVTSWYGFLHSGSVDAALQMREQEEERERERERQEQERVRQLAEEEEERRQRGRGRDCEICTTMPAERHCEDCDLYYCRPCAKAAHKPRLMKYHFLVDLHTTLPSLDAKKKRKKHKKKRHSRSRSRSRSRERPKTEASLPPIAQARPAEVDLLEEAVADAEADPGTALSEEPSLLSEAYESGAATSDWDSSVTEGEGAGTGVSDDGSGAGKKAKKHRRRHRHHRRRDPSSDVEAIPEEEPVDGEAAESEEERRRRRRRRHRRERAEAMAADSDGATLPSDGVEGKVEKHRRRKHRERSGASETDTDAETGERAENRTHRHKHRHKDRHTGRNSAGAAPDTFTQEP